ncbi:histidine phosphatase family protein [Bacillus weihaiensis]|uniref:histidine phosphatase family protein n=1 Tax=Bacillus weihaiensis TaxID=1547283 RepID=UPI0023558D61|nr:histidine phosphatase family protein [Bacillus weihaiensis]
MLTIYLTRHGETEWNKENRLQGSKDSPLTNKGKSNAVLLGEKLKNIELHAIYTSTSERAVQTAKLIRLERQMPITMTPDLGEIHFGAWEGMNKEEIKSLDSTSEYVKFWSEPHTYNHEPHQGESLAEFKKRIITVFCKIIESNPTGHILIVTHAVVIRAIMSYTMNIPTERMWDPPFIHGTSLSTFKWDGKMFHIESVGDTSHLELE